MAQELFHNGEAIPYELKKSKRARSLRVTIYPDARISVTMPVRMTLTFVEDFLTKKAAWISEKYQYYKKLVSTLPPHTHKSSRAEYLATKERALEVANEALERLNELYRFSYRRVSIKNQKTRWGSCSRLGNLNFNYKIALLRQELADYLVAHELCHLKQMNHSKKFWELVERTIPNYKILRRELRQKGLHFY